MDTEENATEVNSASLNMVPDGVYPIYVKDGIIYPVMLSELQRSMFNLYMTTLGKIYAVQDYPIGKAVKFEKGVSKQ